MTSKNLFGAAEKSPPTAPNPLATPGGAFGAYPPANPPLNPSNIFAGAGDKKPDNSFIKPALPTGNEE